MSLRRAFKERRGIALNIDARYRGEVSITPPPLYTLEINSVPTGQEAGWVPETVWTFGEEINILLHFGPSNPTSLFLPEGNSAPFKCQRALNTKTNWSLSTRSQNASLFSDIKTSFW
jgi:hypothetical protein